jgi:hypothetical protein
MTNSVTICPSAGAQTAPAKRYFNEQELAAYAGVSFRTLQAWRGRAQGPPRRKFEGCIKYDVIEFHEWAKSRPGSGQSAA